MKTIIIAIVLSVSCSVLFGQPSTDIIIKKTTNDSEINIDTLVGIKNKKIVFEYDTLFIINQYGLTEFVRCANDLNRLKREIPGQLSNLSGDLFSLQTNVDSMYFSMKSVSAFINTYEKDTKLKLNNLTEDNQQLQNNMESLKKELEAAQQKIKNEKWKSMGSKVIWGAGGFAIGGLLFTSLLLMTN